MYMNKQIFTRYLFLILLLAGNLQAQEKLSLEQAVQLALENNFDIKLNKNDVEQAKNNVSRANAGMLPVVTGMESRGMVEIVSGITATQKVVTANAYTLLMKLKNSSEE